MESVKVFLTTAQKNKIQGGKSFQLSSSQLMADSGKHGVEIQMTGKNHKSLLRNVSGGKGFRFSADKIEGARFFGDVAKTLGKKVVKAVADKGLDAIGERTGQSGITNALKGSVDGLVDVGADKITGGKIKMTKGSPEMREHMARLRGMRKGKGMKTEMLGGNVFDDLNRKIKDGFNKTFNPALGDKIKDAFTGAPAREVYKTLANAGLSAIGAYTGLPAGLASGAVDQAIDGAGIRRRAKKNAIVVGGTLAKGVPLVMKKVGKGFTSAKGTHYGGSFLSPSSGGSFI